MDVEYNSILSILKDDRIKGEQKLLNLIKKSGLSDIQDEYGRDHGETGLMLASKKGYVKIVKYLISNNKYIGYLDLKRVDGITALIYATMMNHVDIVKLLVDNGANVNITTNNNNNALNISLVKDYEEIFNYLIDKGSSVLPLEYIDTSFGSLDNDQKLLLEVGYDLILIENASELFRQLMHDEYGKLEIMLKAITNNFDNSVFLPSATFKKSTLDENNEIEAYKETSYNIKIKNNFLKTNKKYVIALLALDLGDDVGHYSAYIYDMKSKSLLIFDSMFKKCEETEEPSYYSKFFSYIGDKIFQPKRIYTPCIKCIYSLHYSGGFIHNIIRHLMKKYFLLMKEGDTIPTLIKNVYYLAIQSAESQNHFCYMWSIWFIHSVLLGYDLSKITEHIYKEKIEPLMIIKTYILCMLNATGLINNIKYKAFFKRYFSLVWLSPEWDDDNIHKDFYPYKLPVNYNNVNDVNDSFKKSISNINRTQDAEKVLKTNIPPFLSLS